MNVKTALERIAFFEVSEDLNGLKQNEQLALTHCINASKIITEIYLQQVYAGVPDTTSDLMFSFEDDGSPYALDLLKYLQVNGQPYDVFNDHASFIPGIGPKPKNGPFYPEDFSEEEWNKWLLNHPADRPQFESSYTVIERKGKVLIAVPYSVAYQKYLLRASRELVNAALLLDQGPLKKFLELRAEAFLTNDYFESDMAWVDTDGTPFEVTIGPYEVYQDTLFGIKAMFEAFVAIPDKEATKELLKFGEAVPEFDEILSKRWNFKTKGAAIPLEVVADVFRGGECAFGGQFVAYNLPNDRKIHELKGSKKVFSRTMMEAKFATLGAKIASRIFESDDLRLYKFRHRLLFVLGHELAHGIGPSTLCIAGREVSFEVRLKDLHSLIEEAKADMLGMALLKHFYERNLIIKEELWGAIITEVVHFVQGWRKGFAEAHSAGSLIEYNWLKDHGGISYDEEESDKLYINYDKTLDAMIALGDRLIHLQVDGDYEKASKFVKKWSEIPKEILPLIDDLKDFPIEVHPVYLV